MKNCYCIHCGYKNKCEYKYCKHCNKKIIEKDHSLYNYIVGEIQNEIKDNAISSVVDKIKFIIKKHLYGVVLSITVIATVTSNIIVKNNNEKYIADNKPSLSNINITKYNSSESLLDAFEKAYLEKDINKLYTLMYDTNYVKDARRLGLSPSKNELITNIDIFTNSTPSILYDVSSLNDIDNIEVYGEEAVKLGEEGFEIYLAYVTLAYYTDSNYYEGTVEATFFDYDILLVNIDGNYFIANMKYYNDQNRLDEFYNVSGDVSKYDV